MIFREIDLLQTPPAGGPLNMAIDEALLLCLPNAGQTEAAVLRFYIWTSAAVTFGYAQHYSDVLAATNSTFSPSPPLTRRLTGGGIVRHGTDLTFSLAVGQEHPFAQLTASESYCEIHTAIARALAQTGVSARLSKNPGGTRALDCFVAPVSDDLLLPDGGKIVGGAQRRLRAGLLHQGTIQLSAPPSDLQHIIAHHLAGTIQIRDLTTNEAEVANRLATEKYQTPAWNQLR